MATLYLFVGFPGSGKTTAANYVCQASGAVHIWADRERQAMFQTPTHSAEESEALYAHLNAKAEALLLEGTSVVFDTNFNFYNDRERLRAMAKRCGADTKVVWLVTDRELSEHRAVYDSHGKPTRLYGNMEHATFQRIAGHLQPPTAGEQPIRLDGRHLSKETVLQAVGLQ